MGLGLGAVASCLSIDDLGRIAAGRDAGFDARKDATEGGAGSGAASDGAGDGPDGAPSNGCADGTRELFAQVASYPKIAGCSGGWSVPGVASQESQSPACGRAGGNDGTNPAGTGCSVADLCAVGWHVCLDWTDVAKSLGSGQCETPATPSLFLVRAGVQPTTEVCTAGQVNNLIGCGVGLGEPADPSCAPLNHMMRMAECTTAPAWDCGSNANLSSEALSVTKPAPDQGGALCCQD